MGEQKTVRLEFIGEQQGAITYRGPSGREYQAGNNDTDRFIEVLPEDAAHLLKLAQFRLAPAPPPMPVIEESPTPIMFFLNTSDRIFGTWLSECTQTISMRSFPTERGRIVLQRAGQGFRPNGQQVIQMAAYYLVPDPENNREIVYSLPSIITFRIVPLASERIEVQAECSQTVVRGYFHTLLRAIADRWPEAQPTIMTYITNNSSSQIVDFDKISGETDSLTRLRHQTNDTQRKMLTTIWQYFSEHNQWMPITSLHQEFGWRRIARPLLEQLGGSIVFEHSEQDGTTSYELTILGILLTEEGEGYEQLLSDYLAYVVERFAAEPRIREVTSQEVMAALNLTPDQSVQFYHLIGISGFYSGFSFQAPDWKARIPMDIEKLHDIDDLRVYVRNRVIECYDQEIPLESIPRYTYLQSKTYSAGHENAPIKQESVQIALNIPKLQEQFPNIDVLLVTVTEVEAQAVFALIQEKDANYRISPHFIENNAYYDLDLIGGARTFMVQSEMGTAGPSGALLTIQESIKALSPMAVVMVGIAFGVDPKKQHIGEILVSRQILTYELQRIGSDLRGELVISPRGDRPQASARMLARFRAGVHNWKDAKVHFGLILSGEKLVDNQDFRDQLRTLEPEAIGGEMEGAGLYAVAQRNKVDWILVKAICDWADGRKNQNKRQRQQKAARNAASFTLQVLEQGGFVGAAIDSHPDRG